MSARPSNSWRDVGKPAHVDRAIARRGRAVDVCVRQRRATVDVAASFCHAIEPTGIIPGEVTTDRAAAYPPALEAARPPVAHEAGEAVQQRIGRDHQHPKGRLRPTRGFKPRAGARTRCRGHAFLRNLRGDFDDRGRGVVPPVPAPQPPVAQARAALTATLPGP